jgi:hypothetical protein
MRTQRIGRTKAKWSLVERMVPVGRLVGIRVKDLPKHGFFCGVSGSGKTMKTMLFLFGLYQKQIPFIGFEPVRTEYRQIKRLKAYPDEVVSGLARDLKIITVGKHEMSPFSHNPLRRQPGIEEHEHVDSLVDSLAGLLSFPGPLKYLIREALYEVFWRKPDPSDPPIMADLVTAFMQVLEKKGYSLGTSSDIQGAARARLTSLTQGAIGGVFRSKENVPDIPDLARSYSIIEMDKVGAETRSFLTLSTLTAIRNYIKTTPYEAGEIRLVIACEEAHTLMGPSTDAKPSETLTDPESFTSKFLTRMLLELRGPGVGIFIVDQNPSNVAPEVIKNCATQTTGKQIHGDELKRLQSSMRLTPFEMEEIPLLEPGQMFLLTAGFQRPRKIRVPNIGKELGFGKPPEDDELLSLIQNEEWFRHGNLVLAKTDMKIINAGMDVFEKRILQFAEKVKRFARRYGKLVRGPSHTNNIRTVNNIINKAVSIKKALNKEIESFARDEYVPFLNRTGHRGARDLTVRRARDAVIARYRAVISPAAKYSSTRLNEIIQGCLNVLREKGDC